MGSRRRVTRRIAQAGRQPAEQAAHTSSAVDRNRDRSVHHIGSSPAAHGGKRLGSRPRPVLVDIDRSRRLPDLAKEKIAVVNRLQNAAGVCEKPVLLYRPTMGVKNGSFLTFYDRASYD